MEQLSKADKTLKAVVGIDGSDESTHACELIASLRLQPRVAVDLVNVVEAVAPGAYGTVPPDAPWVRDLIEADTRSGRLALERARLRLAALQVSHAQDIQRRGDASSEILAHADAVGADIVAVGAANLSAWSRLTLGSVSRRVLAAAPCSVLIAKSAPLPRLPLRAVFATDHSPYAKRCAFLLAKLAPAGIGQLLVLTAFPRSLVTKIAASEPHFKADVASWVEARLYEENRLIAAQLGGVTGRVEEQVSSEPPLVAIRKALDGWNADLLIVGAHGHGMVDRFITGSVSVEMATSDPRHILVLRPN